MVDVDSIIDCYCTGLYVGTWDWPNYNYFMWRYNGEAIDGNPYSDGKWRFGAFDFDYSVGLAYESFGDVESYQHDSFMKMDGVKEGIPTVIFSSKYRAARQRGDAGCRGKQATKDAAGC